MSNRLRTGTKVRVTSGPSKGQTGRIEVDWGDGRYIVHLSRADRLIEVPGTCLKATW